MLEIGQSVETEEMSSYGAEYDSHFINPYIEKMNYMSESAVLQATLQYSWLNPEDRWNRPSVRDFPKRSRELLDSLETANYSEEQLAEVCEILDLGTLNGIKFDIPYRYRKSGGWNKKWPDNGSLMGTAEVICIRRLAMAHLYLQDRELANYFVGQQIFAFHGTGGISLPSIVESGLLTHHEQTERGIMTFTGERLNHYGESKFVSFSEWDDFRISQRYAHRGEVTLDSIQRDSQNLSTEYKWTANKAAQQTALVAKISSGRISEVEKDLLDHPFQAILGLSANIFEQRRDLRVASDIKSEVGFLGGIALQHLPLILVPKDKLLFTQSIIDNFAVKPSMYMVADVALLQKSLRSSFLY
jgi:hypothetical protein